MEEQRDNNHPHICVIEKIGMICFKDNRGIRPLSYGFKNNLLMIASESIALSSQNYELIRELNNDEIKLTPASNSSLFKEIIL